MSDNVQPTTESQSTPGELSREPFDDRPWYSGISRYQWLVLVIASLGWVFDVFEGQIFVASMRDAMPALLSAGSSEAIGADHPLVARWNDWAFGSFLLGGAFGGVLFGMIADKIGRSKTMIFTILFYSLFTCVTAFAQAPWQMVVLRFLVAMGVGGEWAVASAMVAEVMPDRSRSVMSSIFHASSVFGTLLAAAAGVYIVSNPDLGASAWRWGFAIGVLPAMLTVWVRWKLREPDQWVQAHNREEESSQVTAKSSDVMDVAQVRGVARIILVLVRVGKQLSELFSGANLRATLVGVTLSSIGLVTFWGVHIYGKDALLRDAQNKALVAESVPPPPPADASSLVKDDYKRLRQEALGKHRGAIKSAEMLSMVLNTIGGGLGLVLFGTISNRLGRRGAFVLYHAVAFVCVLLLFQVLIANQVSAIWLALFLPVFGFFTLGMHAGYAVYFPELYPTRLRSTGAGFCFNMGRFATAAAFVGFGATKIGVDQKALILAPLYLLGVVVVLFGRETRGESLAD